MFKKWLRGTFRIRRYTFTENLISALIGTVIALLIILFNYEQIFAAEDPVKLVKVTGYCCGTHGSHGDRLEVGHCAYRPEDYGGVLAIYEAHNNDDEYEIGEFIKYLEIKDCGYGTPTGEGESKIVKGKSIGTIEAGKQIDVYFPTLEECKEFMKETQGFVFVREVKGNG